MEKTEILASIAKRGNGEIYLGVVGAVRTGKSTFIKKVIENLVVDNIVDDYEKKKCLDEIPQSASGKTIMTTEPKFVPSSGATIKIDEFETKIKLVDCVGYVVKDSLGYEDEDGNPRMVKTPWFDESIPFLEAAEIGTKKVIEDHATIGIVVTTDGSFGDIKGDNYIDATEKVIMELKELGKPFIVLLNTIHPNSDKVTDLKMELKNKYDVEVLPLNVDKMDEREIMNVLKTALYEFPMLDVKINIPSWINELPKTHRVLKHYLDKIKESTFNINKVKDTENIIEYYKDSEYINNAYISNLDAATGTISINLDSSEELYNEVLKEIMGDTVMNKKTMIRMFSSYQETKEELESIKTALKMAKTSGYGIVYPTLKDMRLETPEIIKKGSGYGVKLKAVASSIHLMKVDVSSTFEPIIGSELQSKELINYIMKDYDENPNSIWNSEIFGRKLDEIVKEGIQVKLSMLSDTTRYKLSNTVTKIVNKGSNNLITLVF